MCLANKRYGHTISSPNRKVTNLPYRQLCSCLATLCDAVNSLVRFRLELP